MGPIRLEEYDEKERIKRGSSSSFSSRDYRCIHLILLVLTLIAFVEYYAPAYSLKVTWSASPVKEQSDAQFDPLFIPILGSDALALPSTSTKHSCKGPLGNIAHPRQYTTPATHPAPSLGSYQLTSINRNQCMTYNDRYEPYADLALGTTYLDSYNDWLSTQPWSSELEDAASYQLSIANEKASDFPQWGELMSTCQQQRSALNAAKTAVLLRVQQNYTWHKDDVLNVRALITELSLTSAERFDVRILLEVYEQDLSIYSSAKHRRQVLLYSVPREFWELTELWNEGSIKLIYPNLPGKFLNRMSAQNSYRSSFMPVQKYALEHAQYDFIWNWEMETRFTGNYQELFESSRVYAKQEALHPDASKYKTWLIQNNSASETVWTRSSEAKGVGEEADLIVFNPIFDPRESGWYWAYDVQNYTTGADIDRRASIGRNVRFSRPLLEAMSIFNAQEGKSAHCETWPATVVLHSNQDIWHNGQEYDAESTSHLASSLKAVYVPHPVYVSPGQTPAQLSSALNRQDFYRKVNEKHLRAASYYDQANMGSDLYKDWKRKGASCMAPALLHPVRRVT